MDVAFVVFFSQIYFRIHVSVLKLLFDKYPDVDVSVLEEHLQRVSHGPFYQPEFDTDTGQGTVYRSESTTSGLCQTTTNSYQKHTVRSLEKTLGMSRVWHPKCEGTLLGRKDVPRNAFSSSFSLFSPISIRVM